MYLEVKDLKKSYGAGEGFVQVLRGITTGVEQGDTGNQWFRKIHIFKLYWWPGYH